MFELMDAHSQSAVIKVIGVGGGGGNAVAHMVDAGIEGVDFICANTDSQALKSARVRTALQIGCNITKGLGAGADPDIGRPNNDLIGSRQSPPLTFAFSSELDDELEQVVPDIGPDPSQGYVDQ